MPRPERPGRVAADLHVHSRASDGALEPAALVALAASRGLTAIAITDHDTLKGHARALKEAPPQGLLLVVGVEISSEGDGHAPHILGYFPAFPMGLEADLREIQAMRAERIPKIVERLNSLGIPLSEADILAYAGDGQPGRPHVARALKDRGYVADIEDAFERYLGKGKPAYVPRRKLSPREAVVLIRDYGGMSSLAHPATLNLQDNDLYAYVSSLTRAGLEGVEVFHRLHDANTSRRLSQLAESMGLVVTGGSDYHGLDDRECPIGGAGLTDGLLDAFLDRLASRRTG